MSNLSTNQPKPSNSGMTDEALLSTHEKMLGKQPDEKARYRLLPLSLLFLFSGLIFFGGTYLGRYSGHFHPQIYNENAPVPKAGQTVTAPPADPMVVGKAAYGAVCIACHQPTGMGLPPAFPPLVGSEWVAGSEDRLIRILLYGLQGPIKVKGTEFNGAMPAVGPGSGFNLNAEKVAAVLTFVRKEWAGIDKPVAAAKVNEIRGKEGNRGPMTVAELEKIP
jgi:mono/diheme cytochrome c family protein